MSKHTPGPWSVHPMARTAVHQPELGCWIPQSEADARLIAAAPELLEALKSTGLFLHHCWCDVQMNDYSFEKLNQQMAIVDAAIAKADGKP